MKTSHLIPKIIGALLCALSLQSNASLLSFQEGTAGYTGTQDTELRADTPAANYGTATNLSIDASNGSNGLATHALMRFDNIFGPGAGQIALGSTIGSATLGLQIHSPGDNLTLLRMLVDWSETTATWNSLGSGIQNNGTEAGSPRTLTGLGSGSVTDEVTVYLIDVTSDLQAWASGTTNYGWGFIPTGTDGVDFHTSEHGIHNYTPPGGGTVPHVRPELTVSFRAPNEVPAPPTLALLALGLFYLRRISRKSV